MIVFKVLLIVLFATAFYQDKKERRIYWFLPVFIALGAGIVQYDEVGLEVLLITLLINFILVAILLLTVWLYAKFKMKKGFYETFGFGDLLMFLALVFTFSSASFMVCMVFGLLFSLLLHLVLKKGDVFDSVPLAGYLSVFFATVYIGYWLGIINMVYKI